MPKTQLNAFKSMFLIRISNNLLIYKIDQINQISILSFYFLYFLPQSISARSFLPFFFRNIFPHYLFITCCFRRRSSAKVPNFPPWISNNLLIYKIDQINQISILSFYFLYFLPQSISARSFLPFFFRNIFPHYLFITCCFRRRSSAKVPNFPPWIYGCIDTATRKMLWLRIWVTNSDPNIIGRWYLEHLYETRVMPSFIRVDKGTETGVMATMHAFLR